MTKIKVIIDHLIQNTTDLNRTISNLCEHFYQILPLAEEDINMALEELQILIDYFLNGENTPQQEIYSVVDNIFTNLANFRSFHQVANQGLEGNYQIFSTNIETSQNDLKQVKVQLMHVADILQGVLGNISLAIEPIQAIMELVQNQDIYQQKLENIVRILVLLKEDYQEDGFTEDPRFYQQTIEQVQQIFLQNEKLMHRILDQVEIEFIRINDTLQSILEDSVYIGYFMVEGERGESLLKKILLKIDQVVDLFEERVTQISREMLNTERENLHLVETFSEKAEGELAEFQMDLNNDWVQRMKKQLAVVEQFLSETVCNITYSIQQLHIEVVTIFERLKASQHGEIVAICVDDLAEFLVLVSQISGAEEGRKEVKGKELLESLVVKLTTSQEEQVARSESSAKLNPGSKGGELTLF